MPMQAFLVKQNRDAETGVFKKELLNGIGEFRHAARSLAFPRFARRAACVAGASDLAQTMAFFESSFGFCRIKPTLVIQQQFLLLLPYANHLGGLLLKGHPREQISYAAACRKVGVFVGRDSLSCRASFWGGTVSHNRMVIYSVGDRARPGGH